MNRVLLIALAILALIAAAGVFESLILLLNFC